MREGKSMRPFPIKNLLVIIVGVMWLDQVTKLWIVNYFITHPRRIQVLPILDFVLVWNRGISWGLFNNASGYNALVFSLLAGVISIILGIMLWKTKDKLMAWSLSLIIGGALGNLIDRVRFGGVVDFIYFHWHSYTFPAFNIADAAITFGVALMIWEEVIRFKEEKENRK
jgi:signal peptidase II